MNHECDKIKEHKNVEIYTLSDMDWVLAVTIDTCEKWIHTHTTRIVACPYCGERL